MSEISPVTPLLRGSAVEARLIYTHTFGCQMNEYDSLRAQRLLTPLGYRPTSDMSAADLIFLNTCSVREKAEQKVYSLLGRLRRLKAQKPGLIIIVAGCVAQQAGEGLLDRFDHVDLVLGTRATTSIADLVRRIHDDRARIAFLPDEEPAITDDEAPEQVCGTSAVTAPVTVMQGCDNYCAYCIVPYVRGRERSRPPGDVIREIRRLTAAGAREALLLGQNVNSYGRGLDEKITFSDLLRRIANETDLIRLRFTTSHPKDLTDPLIECFSAVKSLCEHIHLPFQAGSDDVLSRMKRGYTSAEYLDRIDRLRAVRPDIALSSDVMVGFPGETEEDFHKTLQLIERVQFDNLFSFRYSDRPLARSTRFPDKVDAATKARRLTELQSLQAGIALRKNLAEVGDVREALAEGFSKAANGQLTGRTRHNRIVNFEGPATLIGTLVNLRITAAYSHSLKGELVA